MPLPIIILEEPGPLGLELARILKFRGFRASAAADLDDVLRRVRDAAPKRVGVFISATVAAAAGAGFDRVLQIEPRPVVRLICTKPLICPMNPGLPCPGLDCLEKPGDFATPDLKQRVKQILLGARLCPNTGCGDCCNTAISRAHDQHTAVDSPPAWFPVLQS